MPAIRSRQDGVALVGHRRAALLAGPERLHELADLGVLEVADFGGEAFQAAAGDGDAATRSRVTVALDDLRGHRVAMQTQVREHLFLEVRLEVAVRADRAGDLAGRDVVHRGGQPDPVAVRPRRPSRRASCPNVVGSAWTEWVRPIITVSASARARTTSASISRSQSASRRSPAVRSWSASAVSTTSLLVESEMQDTGPPRRPSRRPG